MELSRSYELARTLSLVEEQGPGCRDVLAAAYAAPQRARLIGLAGAPGVGKSSLVDWLAVLWAGRGESVAVLAVDPTSRFSTGAFLGDRIRMQRSAEHERIYVRSVSSRGQMGGLSAAIPDFCAVLNQFAFDRIVIETVGTGQGDTALRGEVDCVLAVVAPGLGDDVQAAKAGWMEIGDLFIVNKADLAGSEGATQFLKQHVATLYPGKPGLNSGMEAGKGRNSAAIAAAAWRTDLHGRFDDGAGFWSPPVLRTVAQTGEGVEDVAAAVDSFLEWLQRTGRREANRRWRAEARIASLVAERVAAWVDSHTGRADGVRTWAEAVLNGRATPHAAADAIVADLRLGRGATEESGASE